MFTYEKGKYIKLEKVKMQKKDIEKVISQRVEQANIKYMLMMLMGILIGLKMKIIVKGGSKKANQKTERKMLKRYYKKNGKLPAGNTCFH
jgi:hypothetical protein